MSKFVIKKGDEVVLIAGDDKGKRGTVLKVIPKNSMVIVSGCRIAKKAVKPSDSNPKGGFIFKEAPVHISNIKKLD